MSKMNNMMHSILSIEDKVFIIVMFIIIAYVISIFIDRYSKELEILAFSGFAFYVGSKGKDKVNNIFAKQ